MHDEISAISPTEPVARSQIKDSPSTRPQASPGAPPSPEPPTAHPHKGRLLDVLA